MDCKFLSALGLLIVTFFVLSSSISYCQEITNEECLDCHSDPELTKITESGKEDTVFVDEEKFTGSIHGEFSCIDCHSNIVELPHDENLEHPDCYECHEDVAEEYLQSYHGIGLEKGDEDAPYCWDCHSSHYVYSFDDTLSKTHPLNQPQTCAKCHSDPQIVKKHHIPIANPYEAYTTSIHFKAIIEKRPDETPATCSDCHGAHSLQPVTNPLSMINRFNIPKTCSKCHEKIYQEYIESVHGQGLLAGVSDAPVCTDCHSEHNIKDHTDPSSTVYSTVISQTLCADCHEAERIVAKYGLKDKVVSSYRDSYHGLAVRGRSVVSANCASCHRVHDILPSSDPRSSIHVDNLAETCGECHAGVTAQVTKGPVHVFPSPESDKIIYYVTTFYLLMIFSVIGGMIFHNGLDFRKKFVAKIQGKQLQHTVNLAGKEFERLSTNERIQHFLLMTSFSLLVYTGFAMKFPESWWAAPLIRWEGAFAFRGWLHRISAVVMIGLSAYHAIYLVASNRGRGQVKAMLPKFKDLKDVIHMFKYYFGISKDKPKFERYNYIEKAEYWALIWGTIVMSVTGFLLWFENISLRLFPKWITDVSTVIHLYEAVLATLAILVWHFYFQFFDPHVYPINTTCLTGTISEEDMIEEHPLEYERLNS
ncbi:cytochrome b/b6 domain-containing protein [candidate division KSB1 bacterium]|nr:cytochrome b/b6 domain-containing protein [candidate division KSB1 bacterium]